MIYIFFIIILNFQYRKVNRKVNQEYEIALSFPLCFDMLLPAFNTLLLSVVFTVIFR